MPDIAGPSTVPAHQSCMNIRAAWPRVMTAHAVYRVWSSPARKPSVGTGTRRCSRWITCSPPNTGAVLHCPCGWSWMIRGRALGPGCTFTPCSRDGSRAANTRRGPGCLRKRNWPMNSAAGPAPPRGRSGRSNAADWPGRSPEEGTYRPAQMLIQASRDAPSRLYPHAASAPPRSASPACPPYTRVNRDHQQDVVFADVRTCRCGRRFRG
jgi:hypothetical protein